MLMLPFGNTNQCQFFANNLSPKTGWNRSFAVFVLSLPVQFSRCVFGCPGSHALQRRKDLGELSGQNCDFVFITEEDSGEEPFAQIAADIEKHVACPHLVLEDRAECIRRAILDGKDASFC